MTKSCARCHESMKGEPHLMCFGKFRNVEICEDCYLHQCKSRLHSLRCKVDNFFNMVLFYLTGRTLK